MFVHEYLCVFLSVYVCMFMCMFAFLCVFAHWQAHLFWSVRVWDTFGCVVAHFDMYVCKCFMCVCVRMLFCYCVFVLVFGCL